MASMWEHVNMYVTRVPNRGSPPAVLLRESYREHGKVKVRTLANLSRWPEHKVERLQRALKGLPPKTDLADAFEIGRSLPHGHVAAVLGSARQLGVEELIDPASSRRRDLVTAMLVTEVIEPGSKLACARGLRAETATSTLGEVLGLSGCDEDDLYGAMDWALERQDTDRPDHQAQGAVRVGPHLFGRRSRHAHQRAHHRGAAPGRAGLDFGAARSPNQGSGGRRGAAAVAV